MSKAPDTENKNSELSIPKGFKLRHTLQGHSDIITQIAWSKDGDELATASKDNTIRIFNAETGELKFVLEGHTDNVVGIAWSTYGGTIASVSEDNTIKLWNTNTGNLRSTINDEKCSSIAWSPDGKTFASDIKYSSKEIKFWDAKTETLNYRLAALPLLSDGSKFIGHYTLQIPIEVAQCFWGVNASKAQATISVTSEDGKEQVITAVASSNSEYFRFNVQGFHFSSPTIKMKLLTTTANVSSPTTTNSVIPKKPVVKKIVCTKGKSVKTLLNTSNCPSGYKIRK
jgi:WD40 repeat protein